MKLISFLLSAAGFLLFISNAWAQNKTQTNGALSDGYFSVLQIPEEVTLDGRNFDRKEIIDAFLQAAFTHPDETNLLPWQIKSNLNYVADTERRSKIKEGYPWFYEYLYREKGTPQFFSLNKWAGPIVISTGFPNDSKPFVSPPVEVFPNQEPIVSAHWLFPEYKTLHPETEKIIVDEVKSVLPDINALTGLPASFLPHDKETNENYAQIRIVVLDDDDPISWETLFKKGSLNSFPFNEYGPKKYHKNPYRMPDYFRAWVENKLITATSFTPHSFWQVDGFFVANADNEIGLSICYIWHGHEEDLLRALVRECVVRSLGLSGGAYNIKNSLVGYWNDATKAYGLNKYKIPEAPPGITQLDKFLIRMLYSPELKAGLSHQKMQEIFAENFQ